MESVVEVPWKALPLLKREVEILTYEMPITQETFGELYLRFAGKSTGLRYCYRRLTIFAETLDSTIDCIPVHVSEPALTDLCAADAIKQQCMLSPPTLPVGSSAVFHVPFDLVNKHSYQARLGGAVNIGLLKRYVIVIELVPGIESYNHVLFYR